MELRQNPVTGYWTDTEYPNLKLVGIHDIFVCRRPCPIHNTASDHLLNKAPMIWNEDRGLIMRMCSHGIQHPDYDSALYYYSVNLNNANVHACDGCCGM